MQNYNPLRIGTALVVLVLFIGVSIVPSTVGVEKSNIPTFKGTTIMSVIPSSQTVERGETFEVDIFINPGVPIAFIEVDCLSFDPILVHANYVLFYAIMGNPFSCTHDPIDNVNGEIRNIREILIGTGGEVTIPCTWVTISFTAQQEFGTSYINLEDVTIADFYGNSAPIVVYNGTVDIPTDEDVNVDHIVHFLDLVAVTVRYNEVGSPGWIREDVDNNGEVHFLDLVQVSLHYNAVW